MNLQGPEVSLDESTHDMRTRSPSREELGLLCLHNLLAGANERIYFKDADCRLLLVSDCYLAHLAGGRTLQEVIGKSDFDLFSGPRGSGLRG